MPRQLFTIIETFVVKGYGLGLCPGLSLTDYRLLRAGDKVELRLPDGSRRRVPVKALVYPPSVIYTEEPPVERTSFVLLDREFTANDVPIGTEVWLPTA